VAAAQLAAIAVQQPAYRVEGLRLSITANDRLGDLSRHEGDLHKTLDISRAP